MQHCWLGLSANSFQQLRSKFSSLLNTARKKAITITLGLVLLSVTVVLPVLHFQGYLGQVRSVYHGATKLVIAKVFFLTPCRSSGSGVTATHYINSTTIQTRAGDR